MIAVHSSHTPRNRMLAARMKDGKRWAIQHRTWAYEQALEEARRRSFFATLFFALRSVVDARRFEGGEDG